MWLTLIFISSSLAASTVPGIPLPNDPLKSLSSYVATVLLEAFQDPFGSVHVAQSFTSKRSLQVHLDLLDNVIARLGGSIVLRLGSAPGEIPRKPWLLNMFLVDSYEAFAEQYGKLSVDKYDFSGRYLVVFSKELDEGVIRKIFKDLWKLQIINVVAMGFLGQEVKLWTYFAFSNRACRMVHLQNVYRIAVDELYPDKTSEFHGCLFKVAAFETPPYTIMRRTKKRLKMGGFEGDIMDVLESKLNFRSLIYEPPNGEQWGYPLETNSTGMMGLIQREEVDFGISCLGISVARSTILKAGMAHHTTMMVIAVPEGRPYTPIEKLIRPFGADVWLFIGVVLLVAFLSIGIIEFRTKTVREFVYGRGIATPRLNLIGTFFGLGLPRLPARNFARTLLFMWIFFCFVLRTLYQSAMFQHLQQSENLPPSKTLSEIDETNALFYVVVSGERYYEAFPNRLRRVRHLPQEPNNIIRRLEWMERHPESRDVVQGTLDHMAHHNQQFRRRGLKPVPICREPLTTFSIAIYYPRKSMLTGQFDHQLLQIQAAGLTNYWIKQYGDYEFFGRSEGSAEPRQMSNEHLMVVYELYVLLIVLSVVIFVMELISDRIVGLKRVLEEIVGH
ncbi:uncharacterized protein LOC120412971 [Culex pipiens pallens]|uniref:uncharacterized protein LOC120412971 n=1 Tax=Culex pipiens pallens TaxID=42434 RepID=UPI001952A8A3|nr:uncharacterized protein LOC120412971 [Culex pipiens pallens]